MQKASWYNGLWFGIRISSPSPHVNTHLWSSPAVCSVHSACVDLVPERSSKTESSFVNLSSCSVIY